MDADGLTLACATVAELKAGREAGLPAVLVGLRAAGELPEGPLVSFGLAGSLRDDLGCGTVLDAVRVVDSDGGTIWSGAPLGVPGAREATILAADGIFPTYESLLDGIEWDDYGPGNDPRCEHCGIHSGFEPSAAFEAAGSVRESLRSLAWTRTG